jgi:cellulose synthase/poly-beta-1,6-N-acetylglucosamine synthase-like glycosyltransferase
MIVVFFVSSMFVCYTYIGYPILLWLSARLKGEGRRHRWRSGLPRVAVVIPAYNEQSLIAEKLRLVLASHYPAELLRVVVVSDGSSDDTLARAKGIVDPRLLVIGKTTRSGKMATVNYAMTLVEEEIVIMTDAGEMFDEDTVPRLVARFADPLMGAVSGELGLVSLHTGFSRTLGSYWRYEKAIRSWEADIGSVIGVTGPVYAIRRALFRPMPIDTILDDLAIPLEVISQGYRVGYERRAFAFERATQTSGHEFVRKRRTLAGNYQAIARYWRLLLPGSPIAWQFWSHKVFRLLVPYALVGILAGSFALPGLLRLAVLAAQLGFYGLAALAALSPNAKRPWLTMPYTFCVLNWAAVAGSYYYLSGRLTVRWEKVK